MAEVFGKKCPDCGLLQPFDAFPRNRSKRDGRGTYCRPCYAVRYREHREGKAAAEGRQLRPQRHVPEDSAYCPACDCIKPLEEFGRNAGARNGRTAYCKPCHNEKGWAAKVRLYGGSRNYHLKRRYGITAAEVDEMIAAQGGVCSAWRRTTCTAPPASRSSSGSRQGSTPCARL